MHITNENLDCCFVGLFLHNVCNFNCSYCSDFHRSGNHRWPDDMSAYINLIEKLKKVNKYVYVDISGGEPTLWPNFQKFIDTVAAENVFVEFSTNGSRTLRFWNNFKEQNLFVILSWHYEEIDDDHFYKVAEIMQHKTSVSIPLMIVPENFERAKRLFERLQSLNVEVTPKFTRKNIHTADYFEYTEEQRNWIKSNYYNKMKPFSVSWPIPRNLHFNGEKIKFMTVVDRKLDNFNGYMCTAGYRRIHVEPNGTIKRCSKGVGGILGNVFKDDYVIPTEPIMCDRTACPCKLDAIVEKWLPDTKK